MKRIRFKVNPDKAEAVAASRELAALAAAAGLEVVANGAEATIVLGGDGTFLRAVREHPDELILGINLGGLGYLSAVGRQEADKAFVMLAANRFSISERRLLEVNGKYRALNDIVLTREMSGHSAMLDLETDGKLVAHYMADGLIFATPTGSTAYSLAAGGPVLMPNSQSVVVTPMNPHALGVRPLVLTDNARFRVTARSRTAGNSMQLVVYADGEQVLALGENESVEVAKSPSIARFVELEGYDPYDVLAHKLGWSGSNI